MQKLIYQLKILIVIFTFLLINTLLLTTVLAMSPSALIENKSLESSHKLLVNYVLTGKGDISSAITHEEASHIVDVRQVYKFLPFIAFILLALSVVSLKKSSQEVRVKILKQAIIQLTIGSILAIIFFTTFFIYFHYVLFPQGNWSFPADSVLIQLYPEEFWRSALGIVVVVSLLELCTTQAILKAFSVNKDLAISSSL